jgi:hypothetical protein
MVFRADDILKNAGNVLLLRAIKEAGLPVRVTVLADKDSEIDTLKLIGVDEVVADIRKAPPGEILRELLDDKIPVERIVAVGFIGIELPDFAKGVTVLYLKAPQLAKEGDSYINAMPLVIARALAAIFKDKELIKVYEELSKSYFEKDKINEYQLSQIDNSVDKVIDVPLDNVVNIVIDVPLIKVGIDEEATKGQIAYEAVVASI